MSIERNNRSRKLGRKVLAGALGVTGALVMGSMPAQAGFTGPGTFCSPGPTPKITIEDTVVYEKAGAGSVKVTLSNTACSNVTVQYGAQNDTAGNGSDFDLAPEWQPATLTIKAGQKSQVISFPVTSNDGTEGDEQFKIVLSNPTGATIADGLAVVTISEATIPG